MSALEFAIILAVRTDAYFRRVLLVDRELRVKVEELVGQLRGLGK